MAFRVDEIPVGIQWCYIEDVTEARAAYHRAEATCYVLKKSVCCDGNPSCYVSLVVGMTMHMFEHRAW